MQGTGPTHHHLWDHGIGRINGQRGGSALTTGLTPPGLGGGNSETPAQPFLLRLGGSMEDVILQDCEPHSLRGPDPGTATGVTMCRFLSASGSQVQSLPPEGTLEPCTSCSDPAPTPARIRSLHTQARAPVRRARGKRRQEGTEAQVGEVERRQPLPPAPPTGYSQVPCQAGECRSSPATQLTQDADKPFP